MSLNSTKFNKRVIRFRRRGYIRYPVFEIILTTSHQRGRGLPVEKLGFFNPHYTERLFFIDTARLAYWVNRGVVINKTVKKYLLKLLV